MSDTTSERKAVVLLASIPEEDASQLLAHFSAEELDALSRAASHGGSPTHLEQEELSQALTTQRQMSWLVDHAPREEESILSTDLSGAAAEYHSTDDHLRQRFRILEQEHPERLRALLSQERPQTVAMVLAFLPPAISASILGVMPTELQVATSMRLAHMDRVNAEAALAVAEVLQQRVRRRDRPLESMVGGPRHLARILQSTDLATEHALLENLTHEDRQLVGNLRQHLTLMRDLQRNRNGHRAASSDAETGMSNSRTVPDSSPVASSSAVEEKVAA